MLGSPHVIDGTIKVSAVSCNWFVIYFVWPTILLVVFDFIKVFKDKIGAIPQKVYIKEAEGRKIRKLDNQLKITNT